MNEKRSCRFFKEMQYELQIGAKLTKTRYIECLIVFSLLTIILIRNEEYINYWDLCTRLWQGIPKYTRDGTTVFQLPIFQIIIHTFMLFLVGSYPTREIQEYGKYGFLYTTRKRWWVRKNIWVSINILIYYFMLNMVIIIGTLLNTKKLSSLSMSTSYVATYMQKGRQEIILGLIVVPILISFLFGIFQLFFSTYLRGVYGYIIIELLLVVSAYFTSPMLIGNYILLLRTDFFESESNIFLKVGICYSLVAYVILFVIGYFLITKKDVLYKKSGADE